MQDDTVKVTEGEQPAARKPWLPSSAAIPFTDRKAATRRLFAVANKLYGGEFAWQPVRKKLCAQLSSVGATSSKDLTHAEYGMLLGYIVERWAKIETNRIPLGGHIWHIANVLSAEELGDKTAKDEVQTWMTELKSIASPDFPMNPQCVILAFTKTAAIGYGLEQAGIIYQDELIKLQDATKMKEDEVNF